MMRNGGEAGAKRGIKTSIMTMISFFFIWVLYTVHISAHEDSFLMIYKQKRLTSKEAIINLIGTMVP